MLLLSSDSFSVPDLKYYPQGCCSENFAKFMKNTRVRVLFSLQAIGLSYLQILKQPFADVIIVWFNPEAVGRRCSVKDLFKNFPKFTGKHVGVSFFNKVAGKTSA